MTEAIWAKGSGFQVGDGAVSEVFTSMAEITELDVPEFERDEIEVSSHQSPDGWEEVIAGMRRSGELGIKANWLPTNSTHQELWSQFGDDDNHNYRILLPKNLGYIQFSGFIKGYKPDLPLEEQASLDGKIKLSGKPTLTLY